MSPNLEPTGYLTDCTSRIVQSLEAQVSLSLKENDEIRVIKSNLAIHGIHYNHSAAYDNITGITYVILEDISNFFNNKSTEIVFEENTLEAEQASAYFSISSETVKNFKSKFKV